MRKITDGQGSLLVILKIIWRRILNNILCESPQTTKLYDRTGDQITLDEVEQGPFDLIEGPMPKAPHSAANPIYRKAVVTFVDILGFREIVKHRKAADIFKALKGLKDFASSSEKELVNRFDIDDKVNWTRSFVFSDSVVRARPFDAEYNEGSLFHEIVSLIHAQADLADNGLLIRGGVTIGDIYFDNGVLFGPALIAAYDLDPAMPIIPGLS